MFKQQLLLTVLLLIASVNTGALEYTDVYYNPAESGWGIFVVQSDTVQFMSFFVYGQNGGPRWYVAQLTQDGAGNYNGPLYETTGTYALAPWNPAQFGATAAVTQVADASAALTFTFVDNVYNGLVCTLAGPLTHLGRLYQMNGQSSCTGPGIDTGMHSATIDSLHPTGQGIEGKWTGFVGGGCMATLHFAAVLN